MSDTKDSRSDPMSAPSSVPDKAPDKTSEQVPDKMSAVRNAKKRKAQEDRDALSDLRKQVGSLADSMSNKPEVVTRQKDEETSSMPSMSTEFFRTAVVGLLGLGTFYFSNIWAKRPKLTAPVPVVTPTPVAPAPPAAATQPPVVAPTPPPILPKASPTHFIDMKPKRKIGASGLLE